MPKRDPQTTDLHAAWERCPDGDLHDTDGWYHDIEGNRTHTCIWCSSFVAYCGKIRRGEA